MKRVDNFGAGFLRTGAKAVFASGITSVSFYLRALFTGSRSMTFKQMFYADPSRTMSANFGFYSSRTAGATASMDPELTRQVLPLGGRLDQHHDRGLARLSPPSACSASPHRSSTPGPTAGRRAVPRQPASSSRERSRCSPPPGPARPAPPHRAVSDHVARPPLGPARHATQGCPPVAVTSTATGALSDGIARLVPDLWLDGPRRPVTAHERSRCSGPHVTRPRDAAAAS